MKINAIKANTHTHTYSPHTVGRGLPHLLVAISTFASDGGRHLLSHPHTASNRWNPQPASVFFLALQMSLDPREKRLADYAELLEGMLEMAAMQEEAGGQDEELSKLIADAEEQLRALAQSLNAEEHVEVTPGINKVKLSSSSTEPTSGAAGDSGDQASSETVPPSEGGDEGDSAVVVIFPPANEPILSAPYEVLYDGRLWCPCVITAIVPPAEATDRQRYKAWILGYNVEETVLYEALRPWGKAQETDRKNGIRSGAACHAIQPATGRYAPATVERLTLQGTVLVTFTNATAPSASPGAPPATATSIELPLSHVHTAARFYPVLRKRPQLTDEERQARRRENARRKRERAEEEKRLRADKVAQDASDWQALMGDMMGGSSRKRRL